MVENQYRVPTMAELAAKGESPGNSFLGWMCRFI